MRRKVTLTLTPQERDRLTASKPHGRCNRCKSIVYNLKDGETCGHCKASPSNHPPKQEQ